MIFSQANCITSVHKLTTLEQGKTRGGSCSCKVIDTAEVGRLSSDFFSVAAFQKLPAMEEDQAFQHLFTLNNIF